MKHWWTKTLEKLGIAKTYRFDLGDPRNACAKPECSSKPLHMHWDEVMPSPPRHMRPPGPYIYPEDT